MSLRTMRTDRCDIRVTFGFSNFQCDPSELTQLLGVDPESSWRKGEIDKLGRAYSFNHWRICSDLTDEIEADIHVKQLLGKMKNLEQLKVLDPKLNGCFQCVAHLTEFQPGVTLGIERETIAELGKYGFSYDISCYCFGPKSVRTDEE